VLFSYNLILKKDKLWLMKVFEFRLFLIFKRLNARLEMDLLKLLYIFIFFC
jgi:hypothetical protein